MRDNKIDYVRALCSLTVIIAHVSAPAWINDIRSFDVVALVLISGMTLFGAIVMALCIVKTIAVLVGCIQKKDKFRIIDMI